MIRPIIDENENGKTKTKIKKIPFYFALATCVLSFLTIYLFSSAIITGIYNNTTERTIDFLESEIIFREFVLGENSSQYRKDFVKQHFEKNLTPLQLRQAVTKNWKYNVKINGETTQAQSIYVKGNTLKVEFIQTQMAILFEEEFQNQGSVTGGDKSDSIASHIKIDGEYKYTVSEKTENITDEDTGEEMQITRITYEFEIIESKDESINYISISYSPIFLNIGLSEGAFPEKIYIVTN